MAVSRPRVQKFQFVELPEAFCMFRILIIIVVSIQCFALHSRRMLSFYLADVTSPHEVRRLQRYDSRRQPVKAEQNLSFLQETSSGSQYQHWNWYLSRLRLLFRVRQLWIFRPLSL